MIEVRTASWPNHPLVLPAEDVSDARSLSRFLAGLRIRGTSCGQACAELVRHLDPRGADPLSTALIEIAAAADASGLDNSYHNPQHFLEVGLLWLNLAVAEDRARTAAGKPPLFSPHVLLLGCCAAFGHDVLHDGGANDAVGLDGMVTREAFRLELRSAETCAGILRKHAASEEDIAAIRCLILVTDPQDGYDALEEALQGRDASAIRPEFTALTDPLLREMAAILRDADILPSAGLTPEDHDRTGEALEEELGLAPPGLGPAGTAHFLGVRLRGRFLSEAGRAFNPQLAALIGLNLLRIATPALAGRKLADLARGADTAFGPVARRAQAE
jgi:hypothetical protein